MAMSMTQLGQDPALERFLAAAVGEDRTGTSVSVLSMFARLNVDPWIEEATLIKVTLWNMRCCPVWASGAGGR